MRNKKIIVFLIMLFLFASGIKGYLPQTKISSSQKGVNVFSKPKVSAQNVSINQISEEVIIIKLVIGSRMIYVNGKPDFMDVAPIIMEGRTLLPIRYVAEPLGAEVSWDPIDKKVTVVLNDTVIELWIGKPVAKVNGKFVYIDPDNHKVVPIIIPPGRTMLPVRFVAENLGCKVEWDSIRREVSIAKVSEVIEYSGGDYEIVEPNKSVVVRTSNGAEVFLPEGSVDETSIIYIKPVEKDPINDKNTIGDVYNISLIGSSLKKGATIKLPIPYGYEDKNLLISYWDNENEVWVFEGGKKVENTLILNVDHFSKYTIKEIKDSIDTGFNVEENGWHFVNGGPFVSQLGGISKGLCLGMSATAGLCYINNIDIPKCCDPYLIPKDWQDFIIDAHWEGETLYGVLWSIIKPKPESTFSVIYEELSADRPRPCIVGLNEHAVLAYRMEKVDLNKYYIYIYDPNSPCSSRYIEVTLSKKESGEISVSFSKYKKDEEEHTVLGAVRLDAIDVNFPNSEPKCNEDKNSPISAEIILPEITNIELDRKYTVSVNIQNNSSFKKWISVSLSFTPDVVTISNPSKGGVLSKYKDSVSYWFVIDSNKSKTLGFEVSFKKKINNSISIGCSISNYYNFSWCNCDDLLILKFSEIFYSPQKPDLILDDIFWSPSNPEEGDSVTIKANIKNIGDATANGFDTKLYIDGSSYSTKYTSSLSPGSSTTITFSSWKATSGCHNLKVFVDSGHDVEESNENNNEKTETLCVEEKKLPDLTVEDIWWSPSDPEEGDSVTFYAKIKNIGRGDINRKEFYTSVYIDGKKLSYKVVTTLPAGSYTTITFPKKWTAVSNCHTVKVIVDSTDDINESNENNNTRVKEICVEKKEEEGECKVIFYDDFSGNLDDKWYGIDNDVVIANKDYSDGLPSPCLNLVDCGRISDGVPVMGYIYPYIDKIGIIPNAIRFSSEEQIIVEVDAKLRDDFKENSGFNLVLYNKFDIGGFYIWSDAGEKSRNLSLEEKDLGSNNKIAIDNRWHKYKLLIKKDADNHSIMLNLWLDNEFILNKSYTLSSLEFQNLNNIYFSFYGYGEAKIDNFKIIKCNAEESESTCGSENEVKIRGKVTFIDLPDNINLFSYVFNNRGVLSVEVKIDSIFKNSKNNELYTGEVVKVINPPWWNWEVDFNIGDEVEVYGLYKHFNSDSVPIIDISTCENYYIKKISTQPTLSVDIWVDKGCGSTYKLGDHIKIYGKANVTTDATYIVQRPDGTWTHTIHLIKDQMVLITEGDLSGPSGQRTYTLRVTYNGKTKEDSCSINVIQGQQNLTVDIWVDKGCGATYYEGEPMIVYAKVNKDATVTIENWSNGQFRGYLAYNQHLRGGETYYAKGKISCPVCGHEILKMKAWGDNGGYAESSCDYYSIDTYLDLSIGGSRSFWQPNIPKLLEIIKKFGLEPKTIYGQKTYLFLCQRIFLKITELIFMKKIFPANKGIFLNY